MMWIAFLAARALACDIDPEFDGFDPWLVEGVEIPTDARIVVLGDGTVQLTDLATGEVIDTDEEDRWVGGRSVHAPETPLSPYTTYLVEVDVSDNTQVHGPTSTTFTTGAGPTAAASVAPSLEILLVHGWEESSVCASHVYRRYLTIGLTVPSGLEPGTYVAVRSTEPDGAYVQDHVAPIDELELPSSEVRLEQGTDHDPVGGLVATRDCLTPWLILPSGDELAGERVCVEQGRGCAVVGDGPAVGTWLVMLLLTLRRGRRTR